MLENGADIFFCRSFWPFWDPPKKTALICVHTLIEYLHDGLTCEKVLPMKMYHFHKWLWVPFMKKIVGKIWTSCGPKQNFSGAKLFSKVLKMYSYGVNKLFYGLKYIDYFFSNIETVTWVPSNIGVSQFKPLILKKMFKLFKQLKTIPLKQEHHRCFRPTTPKYIGCNLRLW